MIQRCLWGGRNCAFGCMNMNNDIGLMGFSVLSVPRAYDAHEAVGTRMKWVSSLCGFDATTGHDLVELPVDLLDHSGCHTAGCVNFFLYSADFLSPLFAILDIRLGF